MRLWTVQTIAVWEQLEADGQVWIDPAQVNREGWIHPQYSWLAWQLRTRLPDSRGCLPWWAYCARPDLRWVRHSRPLGSKEVLIEFEPPENAFVAFPCWAWDVVFRSDFLALSRSEYGGWQRRVNEAGIGEDDWPLPELFQGELESSWRRLFSPELPARSWRKGETSDNREAVVEVLVVEHVRKVSPFVGTRRWSI